MLRLPFTIPVSDKSGFHRISERFLILDFILFLAATSFCIFFEVLGVLNLVYYGPFSYIYLTGFLPVGYRFLQGHDYSLFVFSTFGLLLIRKYGWSGLGLMIFTEFLWEFLSTLNPVFINPGPFPYWWYYVQRDFIIAMASAIPLLAFRIVRIRRWVLVSIAFVPLNLGFAYFAYAGAVGTALGSWPYQISFFGDLCSELLIIGLATAFGCFSSV